MGQVFFITTEGIAYKLTIFTWSDAYVNIKVNNHYKENMEYKVMCITRINKLTNK